MLAGEIARQKKLKEKLAEDPQTAAWVEDAHLFQNYKQLQFFDTLALYFNCTPEGARTPTVLLHVPMNATQDVEVKITPVSPGMYAFDPFPFEHDDIAVSFDGRYLAPQPAGDSVREALAAIPRSSQTVHLVAAH
jgi:Protein of unknown function (DUF3891)